MKNRDDSAGFFVAVRRFKAENSKIGSFLCVEKSLYPDEYSICAGGVNEAGFAIANTNAYVGSLAKELLSIDVPLMVKALGNCETVACFEQLLKKSYENPVDNMTSSNFVVMDAQGGAVHYEAFADVGQALELIQHDVNTTELPFSHKTNYTSLHEIYDSTSQARDTRLGVLLTDLYHKNELTPKSMMQDVLNDVCDDKDGEQDLANFNTKYCISRAYTRASFVIEGVKPGEDPRYSTMWVNLGEPSIGVYVPVYPAAHYVSEAARANNLGSAPLNIAILNKKLEDFYDNLGSINIYFESFPNKDMYMNKVNLYKWQDTVTFPIEDKLVDSDGQIKESLRKYKAKNIEETLKEFSESSSLWAYQVYSGNPDLPEDSDNEALELLRKAGVVNAATTLGQIYTDNTTNQLVNVLDNISQSAISSILPWLEETFKTAGN